MQIANYSWHRRIYNLPPAVPNFNKLGFIVILLLSVAGVQKIFFPGPTISVVIYFCAEILIALLFLKNAQFFSKIDFKYKTNVKIFFLYGVFVVIHSFFVAESYNQWRYLATVFAPTLLLPFICILATNPLFTFAVFKTLIRITVPISFIFIFEGATEDKNHNLVYINYISIIYLLIFLLPLFKFKFRLVIILISLLSFTYDLDNRSNMLSLVFSYILLGYYVIASRLLNTSISSRILMVFRYILLFLPILLFVLGAVDVFNVFKFIDTKGSSKEIIISSESGRILTTDSRTGIYEDALKNLRKKNDWIFGSSATVIYTTHLAESNADWDKGRLGGSESGFLGFLTFGGVVYASLFFSLCYLSSFFAVHRSNSIAIQLIGIFISFRWLYSFIENTLVFNFTWITLFLAIGIAFSPSFRSMTDAQITNFFKKL